MKLNDLAPSVLDMIRHMILSPENTDGIDPEQQFPEPTGWHVLCLMYVRPERTKGGIILTHDTRREDVTQGRVGLVLQLGPEAFSDQEKFPEGPWCEVGEFVGWPALESTTHKLAWGVQGINTLVAIPDNRITLRRVPAHMVTGR